jgi:hypothetical protein
MNKSLVTESADMLCNKAEKDIMTVDTLYTKPKYPEDLMYDISRIGNKAPNFIISCNCYICITFILL